MKNAEEFVISLSFEWLIFLPNGDWSRFETSLIGQEMW